MVLPCSAEPIASDTMLGFGIGLLAIDTPTAASAPAGAGWAAFVWWAVSGIIAAFIGGAIAAANSPDQSGLGRVGHALGAWAVATVVVVAAAIVPASAGSVAGTLAGPTYAANARVGYYANNPVRETVGSTSRPARSIGGCAQAFRLRHACQFLRAPVGRRSCLCRRDGNHRPSHRGSRKTGYLTSLSYLAGSRLRRQVARRNVPVWQLAREERGEFDHFSRAAVRHTATSANAAMIQGMSRRSEAFIGSTLTYWKGNSQETRRAFWSHVSLRSIKWASFCSCRSSFCCVSSSARLPSPSISPAISFAFPAVLSFRSAKCAPPRISLSCRRRVPRGGSKSIFSRAPALT